MSKFIPRALLSLVLALVLSLMPLNLVQAQSPATLKIDGFPVQLNRQELFIIQTQVGSFSPEERAQAISARLNAITQDPSVDLEDLTLDTDAETTSVVLDNRVLVTVTQADAKAARQDQQQLANSYRDIIQSSIAEHQKQRSTKGIIYGLAGSAIASVILLVTLWLLNYLYPKLRDRVCALRNSKIPDIQLQNVKILSANQSANLLVSCLKVAKKFVVLGTFYVYLTVVLNLFPWTRAFGNNLLKSLWTGLYPVLISIASQIPNLLIIAVIFFVTHKLHQFLSFLFQALESGELQFPGFHKEWVSPTQKLLSLLLFIMAFMVAFPYIPGSQSPAFRGFSIVLGILASLGSSTAVTNAIAGIILIYTRAFELGDRIQIGDEIGHVEERSMLVTRLRTRRNVLITIPNATVLSSNVNNFSTLANQKETPLILSTKVTLGYDVPWQQAQTALVAAAEMTQGVLQNPAPFVLQTSLEDFYVTHELNVYASPSAEEAQVYAALHRNILDVCNRDGIEILSPHYSAVRDGSQSTIPAAYLPQDYQAPGFQLQFPLNLLPPGFVPQNNQKI